MSITDNLHKPIAVLVDAKDVLAAEAASIDASDLASDLGDTVVNVAESGARGAMRVVRIVRRHPKESTLLIGLLLVVLGAGMWKRQRETESAQPSFTVAKAA